MSPRRRLRPRASAGAVLADRAAHARRCWVACRSGCSSGPSPTACSRRPTSPPRTSTPTWPSRSRWRRSGAGLSSETEAAGDRGAAGRDRDAAGRERGREHCACVTWPARSGWTSSPSSSRWSAATTPAGRLTLVRDRRRPARDLPAERSTGRLRRPARRSGPALEPAGLSHRQHRRGDSPCRGPGSPSPTTRPTGSGRSARSSALGHYQPAALAAEMSRAHYSLQALLYTVALHRYLRWRLPDYDARSPPGRRALPVRARDGGSRHAGPRRVALRRVLLAAPGALVSALSDVLDRGASA